MCFENASSQQWIYCGRQKSRHEIESLRNVLLGALRVPANTQVPTTMLLLLIASGVVEPAPGTLIDGNRPAALSSGADQLLALCDERRNA